MMGTFAHFVVLAVMIVLAVHKDSGLVVGGDGAQGILTFADGAVAKCVDLSHNPDCVPVILHFVHAQRYPPLVSLNAGTFQAVSAVKQFRDSSQNETSASFCVVPGAFENCYLKIQIQIPETANISNLVTLHANPGQQCSVEQDVRDSESIFVHVKVDNDQSSMCCPTANITCNATGSSANVKTPMSTVVEHSSFIITGFERCLEYLSGCYIQYEGGQPAVCESWTIKEFMRPFPPSVLKVELSMSNAGLNIAVKLKAMKYFCSEAGRFIALLLNGSNVTVATFEKNVTEMVEVDHTLVLQYKFSPAVPVQPGTTLTVMLTAVDDANEENFRNSTSISSNVQWIKSSNGANAHLGLIALIAIAVPVVIIVGVPLGIVIYKWHKPRSPVVVERQTTDSTSAMINLHRQPTKYIKELEESSTLVTNRFNQTMKNRSTARSEDKVEMEGKNVSENAINEESSDGQNQHQPTDTEEKQSGSTVQELEMSGTSGPCYTVPTLPPETVPARGTDNDTSN